MPGLAQASCQLTRVRDANSRSAKGWPRNRTKYQYDEENRLRQAVGNGTTATYDYDPAGRRRAKTVNGTKTYTIYDKANELAEISATGVNQRLYINALTDDARLATDDYAGGTGWTYYHFNHQGSVLFTTSGTLRDQYAYGAFGESSTTAALTGNPIRYTGRYVDAETGLYYYRARYYSPQLGRFLQTDPIGNKEDFNLYAYVGNDPTDRTDPSGLYQYTCETGSHIGCAGGFQSNQEKAAIKLANASERLGNAIADIKDVAARQAAGDTSAAVSRQTASTEKAFTAVYGQQSDIAASMATVQSGLNAAIAGLTGTSPLANASGNTLTKMKNDSAILGTVAPHTIVMNPAGWNSIDNTQRQWSLGHDALHAEASWHDYTGPNGEVYYRWQQGGNSPLRVPSPRNVTNPENAMCFVFGGC